MRLTVREVLPASRLGEFALDPQQGDVRAVFVPLARLQAELEVGARVNALLVRRAAVSGDAVPGDAALGDTVLKPTLRPAISPPSSERRRRSRTSASR